MRMLKVVMWGRHRLQVEIRRVEVVDTSQVIGLLIVII